MTKEEYKKSDAPSLNHFYEKLLLLKDKMNTNTGKALAIHRHNFMEQYLAEFYKEWNGEWTDITLSKIHQTNHIYQNNTVENSCWKSLDYFKAFY